MDEPREPLREALRALADLRVRERARALELESARLRLENAALVAADLLWVPRVGRLGSSWARSDVDEVGKAAPPGAQEQGSASAEAPKPARST